VGLAEAKEMAANLIGEALAAIEILPEGAAPLRGIAEALLGRKS